MIAIQDNAVTRVTPSVTPSRTLRTPHDLAQPSHTMQLTQVTQTPGLTRALKERPQREGQTVRDTPRETLAETLAELVLTCSVVVLDGTATSSNPARAKPCIRRDPAIVNTLSTRRLSGAAWRP